MNEKELIEEVASQEISNPEINDQQVDTEEKQVVSSDEGTPTGQLSNSETPEKISSRNFKALREKALQAERERDELLRMLQEERVKQGKPADIEDDSDDIPDDFVEGKHLKKYVKEIKGLKKELNELKQRTSLEITDARLKAECPDFNKVLTDENVAQFKEEHPELAASILNSKADPYSIAKSMYKTMKKFGIYVEDNYAQEKQAVQKNINKIKPSTSAGVRQGDTALSRAGEYVAEELTAERKAALWAEVQKYSN